MQMPRAKEAPPVVLTARISAAVKAALTKEAKADSRTISKPGQQNSGGLDAGECKQEMTVRSDTHTAAGEVVS